MKNMTHNFVERVLKVDCVLVVIEIIHWPTLHSMLYILKSLQLPEVGHG